MTDGFTGPYSNSWRAFYPRDEATVRHVKAQLLLAARRHMLSQEWTTSEAAKQFGVKRRTVKKIRAGRIDKFDVETLLRMVGRAGLEVRTSVRTSTDPVVT